MELTKPADFLRQEKLRNLGAYRSQKVKEYLEANLAKDFIRLSNAPFGSQVLFVQKKDGSLRFCVDYRGLNDITKRNRYPLPLIEEAMARIEGCKYLTKLDIVAAFNQIRMHPEHEEITAFITSFGMYCYRVMPFGLTNGPATWQHYINNVLFDYLNRFCQAYVDDILVYSRTRKEHREHVRLVLDRLQKTGLQVDIKKCEFEVERTRFLGIIVSGSGIKIDPDKIEAILNWPIPRNLK